MSIFSDIGSAISGLSSSAASLLSGTISGAASLGGTLLTNAANANNTANAFNDNLEVADTTFQRTEADMEAAGLNPILAYSEQDPGAVMGVPTVQNVLSNTANSGFDAANISSNVQSADQNMQIKTPEQNAAQAVSSLTAPASATFSGAVGGAISYAKQRYDDSTYNSAQDASSGAHVTVDHGRYKDKEGRHSTDAQSGFNQMYTNMTR